MKYMKFTLRDLFWLSLVVAILCAWGLDRMRQAKREKAIIDWSAPEGRIW